MATRKLRNWLSSYLEATEPTEPPQIMHFFAGLYAIAGALRRNVYMDFGTFQWTPNIYVLLVAPPGVVQKSTTMAPADKLLRDLKIPIGPSSSTMEAMLKKLSDSYQTCAFPGREEYGYSSLSFAVSEFGTLVDPKDRAMVDVLTDLWDSRETCWERITKTQGDTLVQTPCLNLIAATTPAWLQEHVNKTMMAGGFFSRIVIVYADTKRHLKAYPFQTAEDRACLKIFDDLQHDLEIISQMRGEFKLSPEAMEYGEKWYVKHNDMMISTAFEDEGAVSSHLIRRQVLAHKVAMSIAASESCELVVQKRHLHAAISILEDMEQATRQLLRGTTMVEQAAQADKILEIIRKKESMSETNLWRMLMPVMGHMQFKEAVEAALASRLVERVSKGGVTYIELASPPITISAAR